MQLLLWMLCIMRISTITCNCEGGSNWYAQGKVVTTHAMKAFRGSGSITALIRTLSIRRKYVLILTPQPLYLQGKTHQYQLNEPQRQSVHFAKEMISCRYQDFNPKPSGPWPSHWANYAILAPNIRQTVLNCKNIKSNPTYQRWQQGEPSYVTHITF